MVYYGKNSVLLRILTSKCQKHKLPMIWEKQIFPKSKWERNNQFWEKKIPFGAWVWSLILYNKVKMFYQIVKNKKWFNLK